MKDRSVDVAASFFDVAEFLLGLPDPNLCGTFTVSVSGMNIKSWSPHSVRPNGITTPCGGLLEVKAFVRVLFEFGLNMVTSQSFLKSS